MNLHYTLPDREQELLAGPLHGQKLRYCVPYDLDKEGNLCGDGWIAVTGERLYILKDGAIADSIDLAAADAILCVPQIDSGLLLVKQGEKERLLCRFTMRHMVRCSYVARGTDVLCRGDGREGKALPALWTGSSGNQPVPPLRRPRSQLSSFF